MSDSISDVATWLDEVANVASRYTAEELADVLTQARDRLLIMNSLRQVPEVGDNPNISDVLCASFGQYFDVSGIVELDIQDDDQVRPLLAYMAQGVADHFLRDGNKLANLLYSMGEAVQVSEWERVQRELIEFRHTELKLLALIPGAYYMDPPDGGSVSMIEQLQRMADDASMWRQHVHKEANPAKPTSGIPFAGHDPNFCPISNPENPQEATPAQAGAELPEPRLLTALGRDAYTADQMHQYVLEDRARRGGSDG